jgi:hypothetical protein
MAHRWHIHFAAEPFTGVDALDRFDLAEGLTGHHGLAELFG